MPRPDPTDSGPRRPPRRTLAALAAVAAGAVVLALVVGYAVADDPVRAAPVDRPAPTPTPSPEPPVPDVPVQQATVAPAAPVVPPAAVAIDALGIALPVEPVGVRDDGQMEIPPAAEVAGWYRFGATAGDDAGTVVVAAHVDSVASAGLGPFAELRNLAAGDVVTVTRADGARVTYAVTSVVSTAKPEVTWGDVFVRDGPHRLVLVTCGGVWHDDRQSYSDNVVVTAEPIDG